MRGAVEPFWGKHQGGITTPVQDHTYVAALDLQTAKRDDLIRLLRGWTSAAARMAAGKSAEPIGQDAAVPGPDTGAALGLPPARLTVTFGFGAGLFVKDGKDRYGLAAHRPPALVDLPGSMAINCSIRVPAAIYRYRPAPTILRLPSTPFANWCGSPMARLKCAGPRPASPPVSARSRHRAI